MRALFPAFAALILGSPVASTVAWADVFPTPTITTAATVYPQGAEVTDSFRVDLPAGRHQIVLALQDGARMPNLTLNGDMTLVGRRVGDPVTDASLFYSPQQAAAFAALEAAQDALLDHERKITAARETVTALDAQIAYLKSANAAGDVPATPGDLQATLDILGQELPRLLSARLEALRSIDDLIDAEAALRRAEAQAAADVVALSPPEEGWARLVLEVDVSAPTTASGDLTRLVRDASWVPMYDLALDTGSGQVDILRKAAVSKGSSGDWRDIALTLSTVVPSDAIGASAVFPDIVRMRKPELNAIPRAAVRMSDEGAAFDMAAPVIEPEVVIETVYESGVGGYEGAAFVFAFGTPQTVAGNRGVAELSLNTVSLAANSEIIAIPRRDETAFVTARVQNTTGGPLIAGPARISRDGTFLGESFLQEVPDNAEAVLPFGSLETVRLSYRVANRDEGDRGLIRRSNTQTEQVSFQIENLGDTPVELRALYALPVSEQDDLQINITTTPRADAMDADDIRGVAAWILAVPAGATQTVDIEMALTWPEDQMVNWRP